MTVERKTVRNVYLIKSIWDVQIGGHGTFNEKEQSKRCDNCIDAINFEGWEGCSIRHKIVYFVYALLLLV